MTIRVLSALLLVLFALMLFNQCAQPPVAETETAEINRPAPAFILADLNGQEVSLDQYRGKIIALDFWATWCGPCRMTMPVMEKLQKEFGDDMVLLDINIQETPELVQAYVRKQNVRSIVLLDQRGSVAAAYGANSIPMHVLIDRQGIIRHIQVGYSTDVESRLRSEISKLL